MAASLVDDVKARVKSKLMNWNRPEVVETILQLRAAVLSEDERLERYFAPDPATRHRRAG